MAKRKTKEEKRLEAETQASAEFFEREEKEWKRRMNLAETVNANSQTEEINSEDAEQIADGEEETEEETEDQSSVDESSKKKNSKGE